MSASPFDPDRSEPAPAISVVCINKNHADYIEDTIQSVLAQKFESYELIVADGGSTDGSLDIIAKYPSVRLIAGADKSRADGLAKGVMAARGRTIMITTSTDGYLSRNWFAKAAAALDTNPNIAMVWGGLATMAPDGTLGKQVFPGNFDDQPQLAEWSKLWFSEEGQLQCHFRSYLPELSYCVRADLYKALFGPSAEFPELNAIDPILRVHFEFNRLGYLPFYLPILAGFGRQHAHQEHKSPAHQRQLDVYMSALDRYRSDVLTGRRTHAFRSGDGQIIGTVNLGAGQAPQAAA